jgi:hypothetical protein
MATAKRVRTKKTSEANPETPSKSVASVTSDVTTVTTRTVDLDEAVRQRAYEIYQQRGGQHGADLEDWVRAEQEVRSRFRSRTA